jgi:predicted DNA-binding transcriptional regulator YafY
MKVQLRTTVRPANLFKTIMRAMREQRAVVIVYTRANGSETVRTIEPYMATRNQDGDRYVRAMDRQSGETRTFRLDRVNAYGVGPKGSFRMTVPEPKSDRSRAFTATVQDAPAETVQATMHRVHAAASRSVLTDEQSRAVHMVLATDPDSAAGLEADRLADRVFGAVSGS